MGFTQSPPGGRITDERALWPEAGQVTAQRLGPSDPSLEPLARPGLGSASLDWVERRRDYINRRSINLWAARSLEMRWVIPSSQAKSAALCLPMQVPHT